MCGYAGPLTVSTSFYFLGGISNRSNPPRGFRVTTSNHKTTAILGSTQASLGLPLPRFLSYGGAEPGSLTCPPPSHLTILIFCVLDGSFSL